MERLIVSRHQATIDMIREWLPEFADAPVLASASPDDVRGKAVAGNLPLDLAVLAAEYHTIVFDSIPPRGAEWTAAELRAAGARMQEYLVLPVYRNIGGRPELLRAMAAALYEVQHEGYSGGMNAARSA